MGKRGWPKGKKRKKKDPDEGLELRPEVKERLLESAKLPREALIPAPEKRAHLSEGTLIETPNPIKEKIGKLKFIRIFDLKLVPRYLFEQVKPKNYDIDELYKISPNFERDPFTLLLVLADEGHKIKGFLWAEISTIDKKIYVNVLTVDREYQNNGEIILKAKEYLDVIKQKIGFKAIRIITQRSKAFEHHGLKKTGEVIMEV